MTRRQLVTTVLLFTNLLMGCSAEGPPLPEDIYEDGWDETTRSQRIQVLRRNLDEEVSALRAAEPGTQPHRTAIERATRALSSLRPELATTERGRDEYRDLEAMVEAVTGDAK